MKWWHRFTDLLGAKLGIDPAKVRPVISITWGCGTKKRPDPKKLIVARGSDRTRSLFYNGIVFFRFALPFLVCIQVRWSRCLGPAPRWLARLPWWLGGRGDWPDFWQFAIGWKLNGRAACSSRLQSDKSGFESNVSAARNNVGQAQGWACGTK